MVCFVSCQIRFTSSAQMLEADVRMVSLYRTLYRRSIARCHFACAYCSGVLWSSICLVVTIELLNNRVLKYLTDCHLRFLKIFETLPQSSQLYRMVRHLGRCEILCDGANVCYVGH